MLKFIGAKYWYLDVRCPNAKSRRDDISKNAKVMKVEAIKAILLS